MTAKQSKWVLAKPLYVTKRDKRYKRYARQLKTKGFSDEETWSLDSVISQFALPRLRRFREINNGYPPDLTPAKWGKILDTMIFAFEWNQECESDANLKLTKQQTTARWARHELGLQLFAKYFRHLWW